jgi:hypothetical protein
MAKGREHPNRTGEQSLKHRKTKNYLNAPLKIAPADHPSRAKLEEGRAAIAAAKGNSNDTPFPRNFAITQDFSGINFPGPKSDKFAIGEQKVYIPKGSKGKRHPKLTGDM